MVERPGDADALLLPGRKKRIRPAKLCVIPVRQGADQAVDVCHFGRFDDLLPVHLTIPAGGNAQGDVVGGSRREEDGVLGHVGFESSQGGGLNLCCVVPADLHHALFRIVKAHQKFQDCALSAAGGTLDAENLPLRDDRGKIPKNRCPAVGEGNVGERRAGILGLLSAFVLSGHRFLLQEGEHPLAACQGLVQAIGDRSQRSGPGFPQSALFPTASPSLGIRSTPCLPVPPALPILIDILNFDLLYYIPGSDTLLLG